MRAEGGASFSQIRLLALDVDGTLTDGSVIYEEAGGESKRFHVHDGLGIVLAGFVGLRIVWVSGRASPAVNRRARELGVVHVLEKVRDKAQALATLAVRLGVAPHEIAFMGDDLNDLPALRMAGVAIAPADAAAEVRAIAHVVTPRAGGAGAVRDAIEILLRARGDYDAALGAYLLSLSSSAPTPIQ